MILSTHSLLGGIQLEQFQKTPCIGYPKLYPMLQKDWDSILADKTVQEASDLIEETYNKAVGECIPQYNHKDSSTKPIWMNQNTFRKVKRKYSSWIRFLNTKQGQTHQEYQRKRNESTHENRKARREFEKKLASECRTNPKATWRYMKSLNRVSSNVPNLKKPDGNFTGSDSKIADTLKTS